MFFFACRCATTVVWGEIDTLPQDTESILCKPARRYSSAATLWQCAGRGGRANAARGAFANLAPAGPGPGRQSPVSWRYVQALRRPGTQASRETK
ncbi:hypothetical protein B0H12DRAFT_1150278 [Mycena haematopus]|nr:hypothetical protein B0H12DRAFT_1150278 [Mycena haematopus]